MSANWESYGIELATTIDFHVSKEKPQTPGFEIVHGVIGVRAVCRILDERRNQNDRHE